MVWAPRWRANFDRSQRKWSASAGGNAEHDIVLSRFAASHFLAPLLGVVLADLRVRGQSFGASGNDELDERDPC